MKRLILITISVFICVEMYAGGSCSRGTVVPECSSSPGRGSPTRTRQEVTIGGYIRDLGRNIGVPSMTEGPENENTHLPSFYRSNGWLFIEIVNQLAEERPGLDGIGDVSSIFYQFQDIVNHILENDLYSSLTEEIEPAQILNLFHKLQTIFNITESLGICGENILKIISIIINDRKVKIFDLRKKLPKKIQSHMTHLLPGTELSTIGQERASERAIAFFYKMQQQERIVIPRRKSPSPPGSLHGIQEASK